MKNLCIDSNKKDPENRNKHKLCACGGHSRKAKKPKYKDHRANYIETIQL